MAFDVIVIGAGHAGIEAALAPTRLGLSVGLVTTNVDRIGYMSCNPSIGGLGKGHIVRELDILGGEMGRATDLTCIQFKRLNARKGPAVRGSRAQCDKIEYSDHMKSLFLNHPLIQVIQSEVKSLILRNNRCEGVTLEDGSELFAKAVIVTTGTFMRGVMFIGLEQSEGGRVGDKATVGISDQLRSLGLSVHRLKTGTPARLKSSSIDWSKTEPQYGDEKFIPFSFRSDRALRLPQVACFLSHTNERTHEIIRKNLDKSPMFCGFIEGSGPRYCPSIEDKITRFADKPTHQTFLEPESLKSDLIYLQGISTSLPVDVQYEFLRTIPGLENVEVVRPGYAVEYDFIEPTQINHSLGVRGIDGLYLAGQINGTSGYEEAAGQGLVAGANAALSILNREPLRLLRDESYIGVLIDDLVTKGTKEPYRMFTSRAEHRLVLREDNTIDRLAKKSFDSGLIGAEQFDQLSLTLQRRAEVKTLLNDTKIGPSAKNLELLQSIGTGPINKQASMSDILRRPEVEISHLQSFVDLTSYDDFEVLEPVETDIVYSGYINRQNEFIRAARNLEGMRIPHDFDYQTVKGLKIEEREKLSRIRPETIAQAQRISGVNPSAIQAILVRVKHLSGNA